MVKRRIMLVDDHPLFRLGLRRLLEQQAELEVVAEATCGYEALQQIDLHAPSLVLMGVQLPGLTGAQIAGALRRRQPSAAVLLFSAYVDHERLFAAIRAGAAGFLSKTAKPSAILEAVHAVLHGENLLQPPLLINGNMARRMLGDDHALDDAWAQGGEPSAALSSRELEVLDCMVMAYSTKEISAALSIAEQTVKNCTSRVLHKLGVHDRLAALRLMVARGWAEIGPQPHAEAAFALFDSESEMDLAEGEHAFVSGSNGSNGSSHAVRPIYSIARRTSYVDDGNRRMPMRATGPRGGR